MTIPLENLKRFLIIPEIKAFDTASTLSLQPRLLLDYNMIRSIKILCNSFDFSYLMQQKNKRIVACKDKEPSFWIHLFIVQLVY